MNGSVSEGKSSFKMLGLTFSSKLDWDSYIFPIAKTASKNIGALIRCFFLLRLLCVSINLPSSLAQNAVVMSALVLLELLGNELKNGYTGLLVLHLLPLLNLWLIDEM